MSSYLPCSFHFALVSIAYATRPRERERERERENGEFSNLQNRVISQCTFWIAETRWSVHCTRSTNYLNQKTALEGNGGITPWYVVAWSRAGEISENSTGRTVPSTVYRCTYIRSSGLYKERFRGRKDKNFQGNWETSYVSRVLTTLTISMIPRVCSCVTLRKLRIFGDLNRISVFLPRGKQFFYNKTILFESPETRGQFFLNRRDVSHLISNFRFQF